MQYKVYEDIIDSKIINEILDFYHNSTGLRENNNGMDKLNNPWSYTVVRQLDDLLREYVETEVNVGDNIYKHEYPYFPHVDIHEYYPCVNVLIPLYIHGNKKQDFVIFDQYVKKSQPKTYLGKHQIQGDFLQNKKTSYMYLDEDVVGLTNKPINNDFYEKHIAHEYVDKELFFGMTGSVVDYKPGNLIVFDSKYIHCTGKMQADYKIGLSLRFLGNIK